MASGSPVMKGCQTVILGDTWAVICGGRGRGTVSRCVGCGTLSKLLCDGPGVAGRKTCDAPICPACARTVGKDRHLCPGCDVPVTARAAAGPRHDEIEAMFSGAVRLVSATPKRFRVDGRMETPSGQAPDRSMAERSSQPGRDSVQLSERQGASAYRIHVHQLGASVAHKLAVHYGKKVQKQPWMVLEGMLTGQVPPIIGAELLEVIA